MTLTLLGLAGFSNTTVVLRVRWSSTSTILLILSSVMKPFSNSTARSRSASVWSSTPTPAPVSFGKGAGGFSLAVSSATFSALLFVCAGYGSQQRTLSVAMGDFKRWRLRAAGSHEPPVRGLLEQQQACDDDMIQQGRGKHEHYTQETGTNLPETEEWQTFTCQEPNSHVPHSSTLEPSPASLVGGASSLGLIIGLVLLVAPCDRACRYSLVGEARALLNAAPAALGATWQRTKPSVERAMISRSLLQSSIARDVSQGGGRPRQE